MDEITLELTRNIVANRQLAESYAQHIAAVDAQIGVSLSELTRNELRIERQRWYELWSSRQFQIQLDTDALVAHLIKQLPTA